MSALSPFIISMDAVLSHPNAPLLAAVGIYQAFLNNDCWIDSLTDKQFDWFMLFGSTLLEDSEL